MWLCRLMLLLMLLRVNAALVFLSLCLGSVLVQFASPDAEALAALFSAQAPNTDPPDNSTLSIAMLVTPAVLTAIFMIRTVRGKTKLLINALPAAVVGLLGALLVVPLLPEGLNDDIINSSLWSQVQASQGFAVGLAAVVCLLVLWMQRPKTGGEGKHGKHKG
jgi:hypothetical protein